MTSISMNSARRLRQPFKFYFKIVYIESRSLFLLLVECIYDVFIFFWNALFDQFIHRIKHD